MLSIILWIAVAIIVVPVILWVVSYSISQGWHAGKFIQLRRWTRKGDKEG